MGREEPQLVGRRPAHVAGLAAAARLGLIDRPFDRDDDVAEVLPSTGRKREVDDGAGCPVRGAVVPREGLGRQERERQDVGRAGHPEMGRVQLGEFAVVAQDQSDRGR